MSGNEIFMRRPCGVFVLLIRCQRALANYRSESMTSRKVAAVPTLFVHPGVTQCRSTDRLQSSVPADGLSCDISQWQIQNIPQSTPKQAFRCTYQLAEVHGIKQQVNSARRARVDTARRWDSQETHRSCLLRNRKIRGALAVLRRLLRHSNQILHMDRDVLDNPASWIMDCILAF